MWIYFIIYLNSCFSTVVYDNDLVTKSPHVKDILRFHNEFSSDTQHERSFTNRFVLGYITPWKKELGYAVLKTFMGKFTHISPVWYSVTCNDAFELSLHGKQDVDMDWIESTRASTESKPFIVPRFQISQDWTLNHWQHLIQNGEFQTRLINLIVNEIQRVNLDGLVLELGIPARYVLDWIKNLNSKLKKSQPNAFLFLVIPPHHSYHNQELFTAQDFLMFQDFIDGFSLMTYDYASPDGKLSGNAPIEWVQQNVERLDPDRVAREKILLGIALYGYDYFDGNKEPILGSKYLEILSSMKQDTLLEWNEQDQEHLLHYKESKNGATHSIYYPTLYSLNQRIQLAQDQLGTSVSFWELGQGLMYFYELI